MLLGGIGVPLHIALCERATSQAIKRFLDRSAAYAQMVEARIKAIRATVLAIITNLEKVKQFSSSFMAIRCACVPENMFIIQIGV